MESKRRGFAEWHDQRSANVHTANVSAPHSAATPVYGTLEQQAFLAALLLPLALPPYRVPPCPQCAFRLPSSCTYVLTPDPNDSSP